MSLLLLAPDIQELLYMLEVLQGKATIRASFTMRQTRAFSGSSNGAALSHKELLHVDEGAVGQLIANALPRFGIFKDCIQ